MVPKEKPAEPSKSLKDQAKEKAAEKAKAAAKAKAAKAAPSWTSRLMFWRKAPEPEEGKEDEKPLLADEKTEEEKKVGPVNECSGAF